MIENRLPMEATGGAASRKPGRAPLLSPGRQISMEEEVIYTAEGRGGGGRPAPGPQGPPRGVRAVPNPFPNDFLGNTVYRMVIWIGRILDRRSIC